MTDFFSQTSKTNLLIFYVEKLDEKFNFKRIQMIQEFEKKLRRLYNGEI